MAFFNLVQPALSALRQSHGSIVAVTTAATRRYPVRDGLSSGTKGAVEAVVRAVAAEEGRFGVRANCVGPGGATRMVAQAMPGMEVKNPEDYEAFDSMNPGNSAPAVVYLASDDALHVTGQVLRMVGNNLCVYKPWEMGEQFLATEKDGSPKQWDPVDIGRILNRYHFNSEKPGIDAQRRA